MRLSSRVTVVLTALLLVPMLQASPLPASDRLEQLETLAGPLHTAIAPETGTVSFVRSETGEVLAPADPLASPEARARKFLAEWGDLVGMTAAERASVLPDRKSVAIRATEGSALRLDAAAEDDLGLTHVRFEQTYQGLPVLGGYLIVHMNDRGITGVNGRFVPRITLDPQPLVPADAAIETARADFAKRTTGEPATAEGAELGIYRLGLLEGFEGENRLAWAVEVRTELDREQIWIDARTGAILNRISLHPDALYRIVYTPEYDPANPDENKVREEGDGPTFLPMVDNLYDFAGQVHDMFLKGFDRDSFDAAGAIMRSVYLVNEICPNAYWNGQSTNYCPGFDTDDIVSHEWGHAYTEYTHGLIYSYQSGALNESYSDIWGETVDLTNGRDMLHGGLNNDEPYPAGSRWIIGEDLVGPAHNSLLTRDMWDPDRLSSPGKVSSPNYHCAAADGGGVHTNSGVPNHAYAMLVDGQTYNGQTVEAIGLVKATNIYYRAMTTYQFPSANFADHEQALLGACADLTGALLKDFRTGLPSSDVITASDCAQVAKAMLAVEMSRPPTQCRFEPLLAKNQPPVCPESAVVFAEDWESGMGAWSLSSNGVNPEWPGYTWTLESNLPDGESGSAAFAVNERTGTCAPGGDYSGTYSLISPPFAMPIAEGSVELRFEHYVETELDFDGGNVRVSVNGGPFVVVPQSAYRFNAPKAQLASTVDGNTNPKAGEWAWHGGDGGSSNGSWGVSVIDLSALASPGDSVRIEFDFGIDGCNGVTGWFVDDVTVYHCPPVQLGIPQQNPVADDDSADQIDGVDRDGNYRLSWTYPEPPALAPCGYVIEEARSTDAPGYVDDAEELIVLGANSKWSGDVRWVSRPHPTTGSLGYSVLYTDNSSIPLTMRSAFPIPEGAGAELSFDSFEDIEDGYDVGLVEVSTDGGASFERVAELTGIFSGRRSINLSRFSGSSIIVQFRVVSDIIYSTPLHEGWSIDNIEIAIVERFVPIAEVAGTAAEYDVTGRTDGTYSYRLAALFGQCGTLPYQGDYSNVEQQVVALAPTSAPPTASFTASPNPATTGEQIVFDGSASADNDQEGPSPAIVEYYWSFGDGTTEATSTPTTSHAYSSAGTYRVRLTVTDNDGETGDTEILVQVVAGSASVSGGGHIPVAGNKATFGFDVTSSLGMASGNLTYNDHATKTKVRATSISSVSRSGNSAEIRGTCTIDKQEGYTFTVTVTDNGDAGDTFEIRLSNGYEAAGTLSGGDIAVE